MPAARPHQPLGLVAPPPRRPARRRRRRRRPGFGRGRRRRGLDRPHQAGHARVVAERRRRFRLRVSRAGRGARAEPEGALVFLGLRPLHPRPGAGSPRPQAAAIDFDGRHRRRQAAAAPRGGRLVAQAGQVGAGFLGEALDVAAADAHARHRVHGGGHAGAGGALAGAGDAAAAQVRGVAVAAPARAGPPGGKIPAAGRAVADGRGAGDRAPQAVQGARRALHGAEVLTIRTGAVPRQGLGLLIGPGGARAWEHPLGGRRGGLLPGVNRSAPGGGPGAPKARRATVLPHRAAKSRSGWRSWGVRGRGARSYPTSDLHHGTNRNGLPRSTTKFFDWQRRS